LISVCSSFDRSAMAGAQTADLPGRPGLNPLRSSKIFHLDAEHYAMVEKLAEVTKINAGAERSVRIGYRNPPREGTLSLGSAMFVRDERCFIESIPEEKDMVRIEGEIKEACKQADVVLVSIH